MLNNSPSELQNLRIFKFIKFYNLATDSISNPHAIVPLQINASNFYSHTVYYKGLKALEVLAYLIGNRRFKMFSREILARFKDRAIATEALFDSLDHFISVHQATIESEIEPFLSEEDIDDLMEFGDGSSFIHPLFYRLKNFLFDRCDHLIVRISKDCIGNQIVIQNLSSEWHPFFVKLKVFDRDMNEKIEIAGIFGVSKGDQFVDIPESSAVLEEDDLVIPIMNDSGLFYYLLAEEDLNRLLAYEEILKISDLSIRFYIYFFVKVLRKFLDESVRDTLLAAVDRLVKDEMHPTFAYIKAYL